MKKIFLVLALILCFGLNAFAAFNQGNFGPTSVGSTGGDGDISKVWSDGAGSVNQLVAEEDDSLDASDALSTVPWKVTPDCSSQTQLGRACVDSDATPNPKLYIGTGSGIHEIGEDAGAQQLDELSDVNSATVTAGRLLVADGTEFESMALQGDCTMNGAGYITCTGTPAGSDGEIQINDGGSPGTDSDLSWDSSAHQIKTLEGVQIGDGTDTDRTIVSIHDSADDKSIEYSDAETAVKINNAALKVDDGTSTGRLTFGNNAYVDGSTTDTLILDGGTDGVAIPDLEGCDTGLATESSTGKIVCAELVAGSGTMTVGSPVNSSTGGGALFIDSSNQLAQDDTYYHYDENNHRLGIGNNAPAHALDVTGTVSVTTKLQLGSHTDASASCIDVDSDRPYADLNCDGAKGSGEEYLDGGGSNVGALDDLTDVNITTVSSGRIIITDGTNWNDAKLDGDCTIGSDGIMSCTNAMDGVDFNHDGQNEISYTNTVNGIRSTGDGSVQYENTEITDGLTAMTWSARVKFNTAAVNSTIFSKWGGAFLLYTEGSAADELTVAVTDGSSTRMNSTTDANLAADTEYVISAIWSGTGDIDVYVNNTAKTVSTVISGSPTDVGDAGVLSVADKTSGSDITVYEVWIHNTNLSAGNITSLHAGTDDIDASLIFHQVFNDPSEGNHVTDATASLQGTLTNMEWQITDSQADLKQVPLTAAHEEVVVKNRISYGSGDDSFAGKSEYGFYCDGSGDRARLTANFPSTCFTTGCSLFARFKKLSGSDQFFLAMGDSVPVQSFAIGLDNGKLAGNYRTSGWENLDGTTALTNGVTYDALFVRDVSNTMSYLYLNGSLDSSGAGSNTDPYTDLGSSAPTFCGNPHDTTETANAVLFDVRLYDSVLSAEDAEKLHEGKEPDANPYGWWKFDEGTGYPQDSVGTNHVVSITDDPTWIGGDFVLSSDDGASLYNNNFAIMSEGDIGHPNRSFANGTNPSLHICPDDAVTYANCTSMDDDGSALVITRDAVEMSGSLQVGASGETHVYGSEKSSDPAAPAEGHFIIYQSDGGAYCDDGDIVIASTAGGVTNYNCLFDHSAGSAF